MGFETPILILAWRRPNHLKKVIDSLRLIKPINLYISCDGPNHLLENEVKKVDATRKVIANAIDWECNIKKKYSDVNQGCQIGVSSAISWFFQNVEEGIILEDDCVAHVDFYYYCEQLLNRYRLDKRIWCISGSNFQKNIKRGDGSYYFSRYNHCWGWATWKRCWEKYDSNLKNWPKLKNSKLFNNIFERSIEKIYWEKIFDNLYFNNYPDSWAYRWTFTCFINGGLTALPNQNLVNNIGFGDDATHTKSFFKPDTNIKKGILPIKHPTFFIRDKTADRFTFFDYFKGKYMLFPINVIIKFLRFFKKLIFT